MKAKKFKDVALDYVNIADSEYKPEKTPNYLVHTGLIYGALEVTGHALNYIPSLEGIAGATDALAPHISLFYALSRFSDKRVVANSMLRKSASFAIGATSGIIAAATMNNYAMDTELSKNIIYNFSRMISTKYVNLKDLVTENTSKAFANSLLPTAAGLVAANFKKVKESVKKLPSEVKSLYDKNDTFQALSNTILIYTGLSVAEYHFGVEDHEVKNILTTLYAAYKARDEKVIPSKLTRNVLSLVAAAFIGHEGVDLMTKITNKIPSTEKNQLSLRGILEFGRRTYNSTIESLEILETKFFEKNTPGMLGIGTYLTGKKIKTGTFWD